MESVGDFLRGFATEYATELGICAAVVALIVLLLSLSTIARAWRDVRRRRRFAREFGISVPRGVNVRWSKRPYAMVWYRLSYPRWAHPCKDRTRDRRFRHNPIVSVPSVLQLEHWRIFSLDPLAMTSFVAAMRAHGNRVPLCEEEVMKRQEALRHMRTSGLRQAEPPARAWMLTEANVLRGYPSDYVLTLRK